jgi:erythronate-4-phosphate dehydrogenase
MRLVVDENIAFAREAFNEFGSILLLNGRSITKKALKDADGVIVRSITKVDKSLLENSNVKFVGTATIGTDHIDKEFLIKNKIAFSYARGCNADSVAEYVFTALLKIAVDEEINLSDKTIGIVGVGNIGSKVARLAEILGMRVLKNDPPKEREGIGSYYVTLDEILKADIITLHVPLNKDGIDKTVHLINEHNLKKLKEDTIIK